MNRTLTCSDLAVQWEVSPQTVVNWVGDGCPCSREGNRLLFDEVEVARWRAEQELLEVRALSDELPPLATAEDVAELLENLPELVARRVMSRRRANALRDRLSRLLLELEDGDPEVEWDP